MAVVAPELIRRDEGARNEKLPAEAIDIWRVPLGLFLPDQWN